MLKKAVQNFGLTILFTILILFFLEVSLIIYYKNAYKTYNEEENFYEDLKNTTLYLYAPKKNLNRIVIQDGKKYSLQTNSLGLREKIDYTFLENSIIILGDSVVFGADINQNETIDFFFEQESNITTLNFGVGGFNTWQEYEFLKAKYNKLFNTSVLILAMSLNDLQQNYFKRAKGLKGGLEVYEYDEEFYQNMHAVKFIEKKLKFFLKKSELVKFIHQKVKMIHFTSTYKNITPDDGIQFIEEINKQYFSRKGIKSTIKYMKKIQSFAKKNGIKMITTILPYKDQFLFSQKEFEEKSMIPELEEFLLGENFEVISTSKTLRKLINKENINEYWKDQFHPSKKGNKVIASDIFSELRRKKIIN